MIMTNSFVIFDVIVHLLMSLNYLLLDLLLAEINFFQKNNISR